MSHLHPGVVLLLLSGLVIFWLTPISAWWMLSRQSNPNARLWFTGTALYALVATVFVFGNGIPGWLRGPLVAGLSLLSVLCLFESLRREVSERPTPWRAYFLVWLAEQAVISGFYKVGLYSTWGVAFHLTYISMTELALMVLANQVRRQHQSRALWLIMFMLSVFVASNISRMLEIVLTGRFSALLDFTLLASVGLMVNYLSVVFYCYGYWGFVVEKNQNLMVKATEQAVLAREREKLAQVGKLAQSGALSASIAHEVNQPLAAIQLNAEEAQRMAREGGASEDLLVLLSRIEQDNRRAAQVVQRIRAMFRQDSPKHEPMVLDELVLRMVNVNRARLDRERIDLRLVLDAPQTFEFAAGELEHIVMNLLDNAMDSMRVVPAQERSLVLRTWREPGVVCLSVTDSGLGVSEDRKVHLFELLQTTKEQGMGLGLWLSRYIAERHGGSIRLEEEAGPGACFVVRLPTRLA